MKKAEVLAMDSVAYYSGFSGLEIKSIEYGIEDYLICVSGAWTSPSKQKTHRLKIHYGDRPYVMLHGYKVPLDECIRIGV
ncbi:hypothetical protein M2140_000100 [Clostridiales Family XIII bacterium PM5-7]